MKKIAVVLLLALGLAGYMLQRSGTTAPIATGAGPVASVPADRLSQAFRNRESNVQVQGAGIVSRVLSDDLSGSRHQRFILELPSGQTVLVAHNIDLAPRIDALKKGDPVEFYGEYEWNSKGGVVHWTHHDPKGRHAHGWLRHRGRTYQ